MQSDCCRSNTPGNKIWSQKYLKLMSWTQSWLVQVVKQTCYMPVQDTCLSFHLPLVSNGIVGEAWKILGSLFEDASGALHNAVQVATKHQSCDTGKVLSPVKDGTWMLHSEQWEKLADVVHGVHLGAIQWEVSRDWTEEDQQILKNKMGGGRENRQNWRLLCRGSAELRVLGRAS